MGREDAIPTEAGLAFYAKVCYNIKIRLKSLLKISILC
jgi:hypothetical protein